MDRSDFLVALNRESRVLRDALAADSRRWFVELCAGNKYDGDGIERMDTDRVFELMCYFELVKQLWAATSDRMVVLGTGRPGYRMPYAPGRKESFAFFRFRLDKQVLDLCCGVEIPIQGQPPEAPDISLQSMENWDLQSRQSGQIVAMWEGKYHSETNPLGKPDFNQMVARCDVIRLPLYSEGDILDRALSGPFTVSALVTNASPATFNTDQRLRHRFSIIFSFGGQSGCVAAPTKAEHIAFANNGDSSAAGEQGEIGQVPIGG